MTRRSRRIGQWLGIIRDTVLIPVCAIAQPDLQCLQIRLIGVTVNDRQEFVEAGRLQVGEHLQRADGTLTQLTRITPRRGPPAPVFNFEVDAEHVYHVGANGVLVHNAYHHYWPRWLGSEVPHGNKILTDLSAPDHRALHDALRNWLKANHPDMMHGPRYGRKQILDKIPDWTERVSALENFYSQYQGGAHLGAFRTEVLQTLLAAR